VQRHAHSRENISRVIRRHLVVTWNQCSTEIVMRSTISGRRRKTMKLERTLARRIHREPADDSSRRLRVRRCYRSERTLLIKLNGTARTGINTLSIEQVTFAERDQSESLQLVLKLNEARRSVHGVPGIFIGTRGVTRVGSTARSRSLFHVRLIARCLPRITPLPS